MPRSLAHQSCLWLAFAHFAVLFWFRRRIHSRRLSDGGGQDVERERARAAHVSRTEEFDTEAQGEGGIIKEINAPRRKLG